MDLSFVLTDQNAIQFGEAWRAGDAQVSNVLNGAMTCSFTLDSTRGPTFDDLAALIYAKKTRIKVYADGGLHGHLQVDQCRDGLNADRDVVAVTAADPLAVLARRSRQNESVYGRVAAASRTFTNIDKALIAKALVDDENVRAPTWIRTSTVAMPATALGTATYAIDQNVLAALRALAVSIDGFDYGLIPIEGSGLLMADLGVWTQRGSILPNVAYEYGLGKNNIAEVDVDNDPASLTTDEHVIGRSISDSTGIASRSDVTNLDARTAYGQIYDSVDSYTDLADQVMLNTMARQLLTWRATPKMVVTFKPAETAEWMPMRDFDVGDYLPLRVDGGRYTGSRKIDALARVYSWTVKRGDDGKVRADSISVQPNDQGGV